MYKRQLLGNEIEVGVLQGGVRRLGEGREHVSHRPAADSLAGIYSGGDVKSILLGSVLLPKDTHMTGGGLDPVSYTHLDVYKRQG